jgi:predicted aspartyl protease
MGPAFAISERRKEGQAELHFGTRHGELRNGSEFIHDGTLAWQLDQRRGIAIPAGLRAREKAAWPLWVRGHWWLHPKSGFHTRVLPDLSNEHEIALSLVLPESVVGATIFISRTTWLPDRVVVPYERGPFTQRYSDYRSVEGVKFPFSVETSYRDTSKAEVVGVASLSSMSGFSKPALPSDYSFDMSKPAALETRQGAPFAGGTPGHVYVRGFVNDARQGWWHFDSGADGTMIDAAFADELGLEVIGRTRSMGADGNVREATFRRAKSLTVGRMRMENVVLAALDLSRNNAPPGERRMGTIGYDLFARSVVEYGDGGRRVRICNSGTYRLPGGGRWQRLEHIDQTPAAKGAVEGLLGLFQLDTGTSGSVDFTKSFHERNGMLKGRETKTMQVAGAGGNFPVAVGRVADFRIGGEVYRNLEVAFRTGGLSREGSAGTVGREVLNRFTMVFDYPKQRLAFLKAGSSGSCG